MDLSNNKDCTVFICSCDAYEDAWQPFFKLFKKYWADCPYPIMLDTESKKYEYEGLDITCLELYKPGENVPYGERMISHLKQVKTPLTLVLMDDFFLRRDVDTAAVEKIAEWMKSDESAVCFNFESSVDYDKYASPSEKYAGYDKRSVYGRYKYNFQAAIWRTEYLLKSWMPHESPWDWEEIGNFRSFTDKHDFYSIHDRSDSPFDYGYDKNGMGIFHGKWVVDSVDELFRENGINIDYSIRGTFTPGEYRAAAPLGKTASRHIKSIGFFKYSRWFLWNIFYRVKVRLRKLFGDKNPEKGPLMLEYLDPKNKKYYRKKSKTENKNAKRKAKVN